MAVSGGFLNKQCVHFEAKTRGKTIIFGKKQFFLSENNFPLIECPIFADLLSIMHNRINVHKLGI